MTQVSHLDGTTVRRPALVRPRLRVLSRPDGNPVRALVVDSEPMMADVVASALRCQGWATSVATNGAAAIKTVRENAPDVVVVENTLPDMTGLDVLAHLRKARPDCPVLLLSANDSLEERLAGLSAGCDDYVTKPVNLEELGLRLRGLVRRAGLAGTADSAKVVVGDLVLDEDSREVSRGGEVVELTTTEFELLRYLMRNQQRVVSKTQILDNVWGYSCERRVNNVEIYVSYLRKKIDSGRDPMIHTLRRVGYILKAAKP